MVVGQGKRFQVLFTGVIDPDPARQQATENLLLFFDRSLRTEDGRSTDTLLSTKLLDAR